jgi:hypothetical protein
MSSTARSLIDGIFESDKGEAAAPKGGEQATVSVQITGNPKQIQKALKQLAKDKPAGVKVKSGGEEVKADTDVKIPSKGGDKKDAKPEKKEEKKPEPKDKGDDDKGGDKDEE